MATQKKYHLRRVDKGLTKRAELLSIIRGQNFMTLGMCVGHSPYVVALNYAFAEKEKCFYVHCATAGRKLAILRKNPRVWGLIVEDHGYVTGKCTHAYRTVMFDGRAEFIEQSRLKRRALELMIDQIEPNPTPIKQRLPAGMEKLIVLRIRHGTLTGKQSPPPK